MNLKEKTREELEEIIREKGIGADSLDLAERIQRNINLALLFGAATILFGATLWTLYKIKGI
ncbi:MAG: hypothetical protein ACFCU6_07005 [Balneolaceae bacterium]